MSEVLKVGMRVRSTVPVGRSPQRWDATGVIVHVFWFEDRQIHQPYLVDFAESKVNGHKGAGREGMFPRVHTNTHWWCEGNQLVRLDYEANHVSRKGEAGVLVGQKEGEANV